MNVQRPTSNVAKYWKTRGKDSIQCVLCPRGCVLKEGERGFCFARQNIEGQLVLTVYGHPSSLCIDPIEKKPLYHFHPGSQVLSIGTVGCNLGCSFCQNWSLSRSQEIPSENFIGPETVADAARKNNCASVAFTYNDPVIFTEYAMDTAIACHKQGIKTVAVTAGYINPDARKDFFANMDATNVDLKSFSDDFYRQFVLARLEPVLETLRYVRRETKTWLEITTLLIPGANDSDDEINALCGWINDELGHDVPVHFSAFHPAYSLTDRERTLPTTLMRARDMALNKGLKYVYTGNIPHPESAATYCAGCGQTLISRDGYTLGENRLTAQGQCPDCGHVCAGVF